MIADNPNFLEEPSLRFQEKTRAKILKACMEACANGTPVYHALLEAGADRSAAKRIAKFYKPAKASPFELVLERNLSFGAADKLARTEYIQKFHAFEIDGQSRIAGAIAQIMNDARRDGHCGVEVSGILNSVIKDFGFSAKLVEAVISGIASTNQFTLVEVQNPPIPAFLVP
jgi:hypothetical protein